MLIPGTTADNNQFDEEMSILYPNPSKGELTILVKKQGLYGLKYLMSMVEFSLKNFWVPTEISI